VKLAGYFHLTAEAKNNYRYNSIRLHILMTSYWNKAQVHFTFWFFSCNANINGGMNERAKQHSKTTSVMAHCMAVIIT
jgi:hypothetical protein